MTSKDIQKGVEKLDSFLGVDDGGTKQKSSHAHETSNDHDGLECTLAHRAEHESCSQKFGSALEFAEHLVEVHKWDEEQSYDVADEYFG